MSRIRRRWIAIGVCAGVVLLGATTAYAVSSSGRFGNPDAGLTDSQRNANYAAARASFDARYQQWIADLDVTKLDFSSLPHVELNVSVLPPQPTLIAAKSKADRIVVGTVTGLKPTTSGTFVSLSVSRTIKGANGSTITLRQASGLRPTSDWKGVMIADSPGEPLLLPGTRVELFLQTATDGVLEIQSVTGFYYLSPSGVRALELNPFASSVNGLSESQFATATTA